MKELYTSNNKKITKSLNDTVCSVISAASFFDIKKMMEQHLLLDNFFQKVNYFDNMFAKMALKKLKESLIDLSPEPYQFAVQIVTKPENVSIIKAIKEKNYCDGI